MHGLGDDFGEVVQQVTDFQVADAVDLGKSGRAVSEVHWVQPSGPAAERSVVGRFTGARG